MSQTKTLITLLVCIVLGSSLWLVKQQYDEIDDLNTTVTTQGQTIKNAEHQNDLLYGSGQINDDMSAQAASQGQEIERMARQNASTTQQREDAIRREYEKKLAVAEASAKQKGTPSTPSAVPDEVARLKEQQARAITANRIDGLWADFCGRGKESVCPPPPSTTTD